MKRFGGIFLVSLLHASFAQGIRIGKAEFPRFAGVVACGTALAEECPGAKDGFILHGLAGGPEIPDPASAELTGGGRIVLGFLEGKPFHWPRYSVEFPNSGWKWVILNELSVGERNRVFVTLWRHTGTTLDLLKVFPRFLPLGFGETTVHSRAPLPDGSLLVVLKGDGSEAGVRLQDFRLLRLSAPDGMAEVYRRSNRSEIPIGEILERLNADEAVEPVLDSTLACAFSRRQAPSGGPMLLFTTSRIRVLHTRAGPQETPAGSTTDEVDIWKLIKAGAPAR